MNVEKIKPSMQFQQVNKTCFRLTLIPSNYDPSLFNSLFLFGSEQSVESNVDLLADYNRVYGFINNRNHLEALELRFGSGAVQNVQQTGLQKYSSKFFYDWLVNKKATVVKLSMQGEFFNDDSDTQKTFSSYPLDIWKSNGVGALQKTHSLELKRINESVQGLNNSRPVYELEEIFCFDHETVIAVPTFNNVVVPVPPPPVSPAVIGGWQETGGVQFSNVSRGAETINNGASPLDGLTFVAGYTDNVVYVYNYLTLVQTIVMPVGVVPNDVAYFPDRDTVFVACINGSQIYEIDNLFAVSVVGASGAVDVRVIYNAKNSLMYVLGQGSNNLFKIDVFLNITTIPIGFGGGTMEANVNSGEVMILDSALPQGVFVSLADAVSLPFVTSGASSYYFTYNFNTDTYFITRPSSLIVDEYDNTGVVTGNIITASFNPISVFYDVNLDLYFVGTGVDIEIFDNAFAVVSSPVPLVISANTHNMFYDQLHNRFGRIINAAAGYTLEWIALVETTVYPPPQYKGAYWFQLVVDFLVEDTVKGTEMEMKEIPLLHNGSIDYVELENMGVIVTDKPVAEMKLPNNLPTNKIQ